VTSNKQFFLDIPSGFTRANSISNVPCAPVLALGQINFKTLIFFYGPALDDEAAIVDGGGAPRDGAGTVLDEVTRSVPTFTFFMADFSILRPFIYPSPPERHHYQEAGVGHKPPPSAPKHN
jgi:hypothetical protein